VIDDDDDDDDVPFRKHSSVLKESIGLIDMDYDDCLISILGELGVPGILEPIEVGKNGDIFYVTNQEEITKFNLNTEMIEEIGVKGSYECCQVVIYNESLLPIGEILS
jgi:hypothetical protein